MLKKSRNLSVLKSDFFTLKVLVDEKSKKDINRIMSSFERCDLCKKIIKKKVYSVRGHDYLDYCEKCWLDEKNWPKIHIKSSRNLL